MFPSTETRSSDCRPLRSPVPTSLRWVRVCRGSPSPLTPDSSEGTSHPSPPTPDVHVQRGVSPRDTAHPRAAVSSACFSASQSPKGREPCGRSHGSRGAPSGGRTPGTCRRTTGCGRPRARYTQTPLTVSLRGRSGAPGRTLLPLAALPGDVCLLPSSGRLPVTPLPAQPRLRVTAVPSGGQGTDARQAEGKSAGSRAAQLVPEWRPLPPPPPATSARLAGGASSTPDAHRPALAEITLFTAEATGTVRGPVLGTPATWEREAGFVTGTRCGRRGV